VASQQSVNNSQSVSQLAASIRKKKRSKDRSETRHQRVRTHCKREIVMTTSGVGNKQCNKSNGVISNIASYICRLSVT
jgi:hypothetical protein